MFRSLAVSLLAVAAGSAQAAAPEVNFNATLAGSVRLLDSDFEFGDDNIKPVNNASSVSLGFKAPYAGVMVFGLAEAGEKNKELGIDALRQAFVGVETGIGQFLVGKKASEYRLSGEKLDPFYDTSVVGFNGREAREGASYGLSNLTNGFSHNTVGYLSPALLGGLRLNAAAYVSSEDAPNDEIDYGVGAEYALPGFADGHSLSAGVQYLKIENPASNVAGNPSRNGLVTVGGSPGVSDSYRVYGSYAAGSVVLSGSYENVDVAAEADARAYYYLSGTWALCDKTQIAASYGWLDFAAGSPALSGEGYSLGVFHELASNLKGYAAARQVSLDVPGDTATIAVGLSYSIDARATTR